MWDELNQNADAILASVTDEVSHNLSERPPGGRKESDDQSIFRPLTIETGSALRFGQYHLAMRMYQQCMYRTREFEKANPGTSIHKALPAFNVGLAHLRAFDFTAALHYFELAQEEMRLTTGGHTWKLFTSTAFELHFWETVEAGANSYPFTLYDELWQAPFGKSTAKANWSRLSHHSKLGYIYASAERLRLRQLVDLSRFPVSETLSLAYWALIGDLLRILETEVKRRARLPSPKPSTLFPLLRDGFINTRVGQLSAAFMAIHNAGPVNSTQTFNNRFPALRSVIVDRTRPRNERVQHAVYLLYATRNQVQHHVDRTLIIFRSIPDALFVTELLFCLCRLESWTRT